MNSVLIANRDSIEIKKLNNTLSNEFDISTIASQEGLDDQLLEESDLILLDHNFTENSGIDFLMSTMGKSYIPVLMLTPPDDPQCAIESIRAGAYNYIVKAGDFYQVLNISIKEAIEKFNTHTQMKQTIITQKDRIDELEKRLSLFVKGDIQVSPQEAAPLKEKESIIQNVVARFKSGEINLPSLPQTNIKFRELINKGANLQEVANLLKQDAGISSKLISVSNTAYYRGVNENNTLDQAVSRLGLGVTKKYVDVISNRAFYTTNNKKYVKVMEKLWEHSLSCAYASQIVSQILKRRNENEAFTMGLLHDIGKLVLLQVVAELEAGGKFNEGINQEKLYQTLDSFHGNFGAVLLKRWEFPQGYIQISKYHNNLEGADSISKDLFVVHFSNLLVKSMGYTQSQQTEINLEEAESMSILRLNSSMISEVKDKLKALMEGTSHIFA